MPKRKQYKTLKPGNYTLKVVSAKVKGNRVVIKFNRLLKPYTLARP